MGTWTWVWVRLWVAGLPPWREGEGKGEPWEGMKASGGGEGEQRQGQGQSLGQRSLGEAVLAPDVGCGD